MLSTLCTWCGSTNHIGAFMGSLGRLLWYRCGACGADYPQEFCNTCGERAKHATTEHGNWTWSEFMQMAHRTPLDPAILEELEKEDE